MGRAYIFNQHLNNADRSTVESAVVGAGYTPIYGFPLNISSVDPDSDIGVVGLPAEAEDEAAINAGLLAFGGAGIRVITIWLHKDESGIGLPEGVDKYGSSAVDIASPELVSTLKGENEVWEEPGGAPRPAPNTKRNRC